MNSPFFDSYQLNILKMAIDFYSDKNDPQIVKALICSFIAHGGKQDKEGAPYFTHPLNVSKKFKLSDEIIVALLHDVLEDSKITKKNLRDLGFSERIIEAVKTLTRKKFQSYKNYLLNVTKNPLSLRIKEADIQNNLDPIRLKKLSLPLQKRLKKKYSKALEILKPYL